MRTHRHVLPALGLGLIAFGAVCPASFVLGFELIALAFVFREARALLPELRSRLETSRPAALA